MIGVFDSGVGGLTVLSQIRHKLPDVSLLYLGDHAFSPYGDLSERQVYERSAKVTQWLLNQGAQMVVIACNTATAIAIDQLREQFDIPIVGVEPGIKPAALSSQTQKIAILATENTVASRRYSALIERFLPNVEVISQGCSGLVEAIESMPENIEPLLRRFALPMVEGGADQIVLGCTHYPLIKHQLQRLLPSHVGIVDTSEAVALEVRRRYQCLGHAALETASLSLFTTGPLAQVSRVIDRYESLGYLQNVPVQSIQL